MVSEDKKVKLRKIVKAVGISVECVGPILHNELHTKKLSARTVMTSSRASEQQIRIFDDEGKCKNAHGSTFICEIDVTQHLVNSTLCPNCVRC